MLGLGGRNERQSHRSEEKTAFPLRLGTTSARPSGKSGPVLGVLGDGVLQVAGTQARRGGMEVLGVNNAAGKQVSHWVGGRCSEMQAQASSPTPPPKRHLRAPSR